ncbi:hypothetical protein Ga0080559_TMP3262 [Salipiger profundus]|uniref:Uncharacterized protein n=1 Tax=Salipiger profundus TaxID=1229727 RepID=A0A1U7D7H2_9RHOB|nr:hypothetical protein Ga0080559_TMP3262 [Salipiger profundus]
MKSLSHGRPSPERATYSLSGPARRASAFCGKRPGPIPKSALPGPAHAQFPRPAIAISAPRPLCHGTD